MDTKQPHDFKPWTCEAAKAHKKTWVKYKKDGTALVNISGKKFTVPTDRQYDLTQATILGLNERLTMSANSPKYDDKKTLRDLFNEEWEAYNRAISKSKPHYFNYGYYAFYPQTLDLVRYASPFWHRIVSVASNSKLITDPAQKLLWKDIQKKFEGAVIGIAGCSVGNSIAHTVCMDIRPQNLKIADKSLFKMENINRVRLSYKDIVKPNSESQGFGDMLLKNKAVATAQQIYSINPFADIYIYNEGLNEKNIGSFFNGSKTEPRLDLIIEEVDDPRIKIRLRQEARKRRVPLLMVTDAGSCVQLDIRRFDLAPKAGLAYGVSDKRLVAAMENFYNNPGDRKIFFKFVDALIGHDYRQGELKRIIENKTEIPTSTIIPQLGSTINTAAGIISEAAARIILGYNYPSRVLFNKRTFKVKAYG